MTVRQILVIRAFPQENLNGGLRNAEPGAHVAWDLAGTIEGAVEVAAHPAGVRRRLVAGDEKQDHGGPPYLTRRMM